MCLIGTFKQKLMEDKLEETQAKAESSFLDEPNKELKYLKKKFRLKHKSKDSPEVELLKKVTEVRCKIKAREDGDALKMSFVQVTVHGKNFSALVDTGATHSFPSRKEPKCFGKKVEVGRESSDFKVLKSTMKAMTGILKDTQVRVGSWFGKLDMRVTDLNDHTMVLGQDFWKATQAIPMVD